MSIVETIKKLAEANGMTLASLERKLGISNGAIAKYDTNAPSVIKLCLIADFFSVSTDYLLGRVGNSNKCESCLYSGLSDDQKEELRSYATYIKKKSGK